MQNEFHVTNGRYHLNDVNQYIVQGWFSKNNIFSNEFQAFADEERLNVQLIVGEGIPYKQGDLVVSNIFFVCISLPKSLEKYSQVSLHELQGSERRVAYSITVQKLLKVKDNLPHAIDRVVKCKGKVFINGWAACQDELKVQVKDERGTVLKSEMTILPRYDVACEYPEAEKEELHGFRIVCDGADAKKLGVYLSANAKQAKSYYRLRPSQMRKIIRGMVAEGRELYSFCKREGVKSYFEHRKSKRSAIDYDTWIKKRLITEEDLKEQRKKRFSYEPKFSVVIPLYNTDVGYLDEIIESILNQSYTNLEICFADGSNNNRIELYLQENFGTENRIVYKRLAENKGISKNTNEALQLATGDFVMLSDHDDIVEKDALYEMVKALNEDQSIDVLYTDEDKIDMEGVAYFESHLKPDYNIDMLRSTNYICHIFVARKTVVDRIGEFNADFDGAQDYDFILRCCEQAKTIHHIPKILYHWRSHPASTAGDPASKMYAYIAGEKAVQAHYERLGIKAEVKMTERFGRYRTRLLVEGDPKVSIIVWGNSNKIDTCEEDIRRKSTYQNYQIVTAKSLKEINHAASEAEGEYLVFVSEDIAVLTDDWIEEMLGYCQRKDVGAVGGRLIDEFSNITHAGIVLGLYGLCGRAFEGMPDNMFTYVGRCESTQDMSAVSMDCMMTSKEIFIQMGQFDLNYEKCYADVDYCLRLRESNKVVVYHAFVKMRDTKQRKELTALYNQQKYPVEANRLRMQYEKLLDQGDPYYNEQLSLNAVDCTLKLE